MAEQQKDFERIEQERFALTAFKCPWRLAGRSDPSGRSYCIASVEVCRADGCAVWQVVKDFGGGI